MILPGASLLLSLALSCRAAEPPLTLKDTPSLRSGGELPAIGIELTTDKFRVGKPFEMTLRLPPVCKKVGFTLPGSKVYKPADSRWVPDRGLVFSFEPIAPGAIALREFKISCPGWAGLFKPLRLQVTGAAGIPQP